MIQTDTVNTVIAACADGLPPEARQLLPGYDSGILCLVIFVFLLLAYNFFHSSTFLKNFNSDLWGIRRTDDSSAVRTFSETGIQISIVLMGCLCQGIIVCSAYGAGNVFPKLSTFATVAALTAIAIIYYLWQLLAYSVVGHIFIDKFSAHQWLKGFNASQALLGIILTVPALIVLFNPEHSKTITICSIICYISARLIFIFKGFRLFYDNFGSLLYFILYLCTLEIIPPIIIFRFIGYFSQLQPW